MYNIPSRCPCTMRIITVNTVFFLSLCLRVSTVILDEVHERGMDSDFTLALLMFAMAERRDLKLILMV